MLGGNGYLAVSMKLLLVSDLHSDPAKLDWVAMQAATFDAIIVAGELIPLSARHSFQASDG
jgi:Icc-related predicted phosphoesterase